MARFEGTGISTLTRRTILKTGAAAAVATIARPAILRAAEIIKIGHVAPQTGPMADSTG